MELPKTQLTDSERSAQARNKWLSTPITELDRFGDRFKSSGADRFADIHSSSSKGAPITQAIVAGASTLTSSPSSSSAAAKPVVTRFQSNELQKLSEKNPEQKWPLLQPLSSITLLLITAITKLSNTADDQTSFNNLVLKGGDIEINELFRSFSNLKLLCASEVFVKRAEQRLVVGCARYILARGEKGVEEAMRCLADGGVMGSIESIVSENR